MQVERLTHENERLLDRILEKPQVEENPLNTDSLKPIQSSRIPWGVKRSLLEAESRVEARIRADRAKEINTPSKSTEDLERDIEVS